MQYSKLLAALLCLWPSLAWAQLPLTGAGGSGVAANYYTDATSGGSDSNDCLTTSTACLTLAHLNTLNLPAHAVVHCLGSFGSGDALAFTTSNSAGYVTVTDYGAGCTINSGNSTAGITATNLPDVHIIKATALNIVGGGNTTNTTAGISIVNSQAGNTKLVGPSISGVTVSGYGKNCIEVKGTLGTSGFNDISIANPIAHDCTGNYQPQATNYSGSSCINVFSEAGYGSGFTAPSHTNVTISGFTVYNCTGTSGSVNWSGSGVTVFQTLGYTITNGIAHDYGVNSISPGGIWTGDGGNCKLTFNEVYNGNGATQNSYDFDGGTVNCVGMYNKAHNNTGTDYAAENYNDGICCALWGNNTWAFNEGQNAAVSEFLVYYPAPATGPLYVYRNTFVSQLAGANLITQGNASSAISGTFANNILIETFNGDLVALANPSSLNFNGNDYYTYGQPFKILWNATTYTSLASWQAATGQEKISGSNVGLTSNPSLYVPGGLFTTGGYFPAQDIASNLQSGSPMIGGGVALAQFGITLPATDYYGATVAANSQTVGAAEGDFTTFAASCPPATTFLARVSSFAKADNVNYNSLICGLNSDGQLSLIDVLYILAAPNSAASLLNLQSTSYSLVSHGTTTFTARHGIAGDGSTGYLDTQWVPSSNGVNWTLTSASHLAYAQTNGLASTLAFLGVQNSAGTAEASSYSGTSGGWYADLNDEAGATSNPTTASNGSFLLTRNPTGDCSGGVHCLDLIYNGVNVHNNNPSPIAVPNQNMILLAFNNGTGSGIVPNAYTTNQLSAVAFGAGSVSWTLLPYRINSFMQAYGINVY